MIRNENIKEKKVRIKVDRAKPKNSAIEASAERSAERDSLRMTRRRSTLIQFIQRRFLGDTSTSESEERRDDISRSNGKGGNPLLILLLVCVILTWGFAATLVFDLVDYKGLVEKGKNIGSEIQEEDIKNAVGALYPFQYEIVRHPIRSLGQGLINIDDYITEALSPRKDPYQLTDSRKPVPPSGVVKRVKKRASWADELPPEETIPQKLLDKYPVIGDIQPYKNSVKLKIEKHAESASEYIFELRRKRVLKNGHIIGRVSGPSSEEDFEIPVPTGVWLEEDYEILVNTDLFPDQEIYEVRPEIIPEMLWKETDDFFSTHGAKRLIYIDSQKGHKDYLESTKALKNLIDGYPNVAYVKYLYGEAMNLRAEHLRSNDVLQEAVKVLQEVANDESALQDVRNKAAELAADRLRFLGKRGGALKMGRLLVDSNPTRNFKHLKDVGVTCLIIGNNVEAERYFRRAVEQDPTDGFSLVHLGFALKMQDKYEECLAPFEDGVKSLEPGTDESKFRYHWGDALMRLGRKPEADEMFEEAAQAGIFLSKFQRSTYNIDRLTGRPYWQKSQLDATLQSYWTRLENKWEMMRDEALALMDENLNFPNFEKEAEGLQKEGDWRQFTLWQQGRKQEKECKLTPKTCALIQEMKEATSCRRGQIKFSVMKEGTVVWPHTGPTNCRLRLHLGLRVPEDFSNLALTVADKDKHWENGKAFVFDDSFEHSVQHNGSSYRLILILDFWHPEMSDHEKRTVTAI